MNATRCLKEFTQSHFSEFFCSEITLTRLQSKQHYHSKLVRVWSSVEYSMLSLIYVDKGTKLIRFSNLLCKIMAEATSGMASITTRYPRLLRIVDELEKCGKIVTSKADHFRHLFRLDPILHAITYTLDYGLGQTRSRTHKRARSFDLEDGSPQGRGNGASIGVGNLDIPVPDFEIYQQKRIRVFYGFGKFADGYNGTILSRRPVRRRSAYGRTPPIIGRMLLSNRTCGHTTGAVPSLSPAPEAPAALVPPQSTETTFTTGTCVSCDDTLSLTNMVKFPCEHYSCKDCFANLIQAQVSTTGAVDCCGIAIPLTNVARYLPVDLFSRYLACQNKNNKRSALCDTKQEVKPPAAPARSPSLPIDKKPLNEPLAKMAPKPSRNCTHEDLSRKRTYTGKCSYCGYNRCGGDSKHHYIMQCNDCEFTACRRCDDLRSWE